MAFRSAWKGPAYILLIRTSLAALRGHLPPLLEFHKWSEQKENQPGTSEKDGSCRNEARCWSGCPFKLRGRLGPREAGWPSRHWKGHLPALEMPPITKGAQSLPEAPSFCTGARRRSLSLQPLFTRGQPHQVDTRGECFLVYLFH